MRTKTMYKFVQMRKKYIAINCNKITYECFVVQSKCQIVVPNVHKIYPKHTFQTHYIGAKRHIIFKH